MSESTDAEPHGGAVSVRVEPAAAIIIVAVINVDEIYTCNV